MKTYTKLSMLAASFLIGSISLQAQEAIDSGDKVYSIRDVVKIGKNTDNDDITIDEKAAIGEQKHEIISEIGEKTANTKSIQNDIDADGANKIEFALEGSKIVSEKSNPNESETVENDIASDEVMEVREITVVQPSKNDNENSLVVIESIDAKMQLKVISEDEDIVSDEVIINVEEITESDSKESETIKNDNDNSSVTIDDANIEVELADENKIILDDAIDADLVSQEDSKSPNDNIIADKVIELEELTTAHSDIFVDDENTYSISLPNNGLIYISEDTAVGEAVLSIASLPYASIVDGAISEQITFLIRSNYSAFIERMEISIYKASDIDLIEPLVTIPITSSAFSKVTWDGKLPDTYLYKTGDELIYVLRAYDKEGRFDESVKNSIWLLKPEDVGFNKNELREEISKGQGVLLNNAEAANKYLLDKAFALNSLYTQNIVTYGSKVIIKGVSLPDDAQLFINNEEYPIDLEKKFTAEFIVPPGTHYYDIALEGKENIHKILKMDINDNYFFGVAIADFTISKTQTIGSYDNKDSDLLKDGRLAFYLKSRLYSKYQITAQADTTQKNIKELFKGFTQADATDILESLDPDMYYPTYGDDSVTFKDINTQGRFYVRADWDKSQALWGNYNTNFDGMQYGGYSRSLYGAKLDYRSVGINELGDAKTIIKAFGSEAQSVAGHSEFLGTGGSLYYLKNTNIIPGSDKLLLQVTDISTGNMAGRVELIRGADYEIDSVQGRIILTRPLSQMVYQGINSITSTTPLGGYEQRLIADYEYVPDGFKGDVMTAGVRVKQWFGDHAALGGTYVVEEQNGNDYEITAGDLTLQAGKGTYLKTEIAKTKSKAAPIYYSANGGLSFTSLGSLTNDISGEALAVDIRANFKELGFTDNDFTAGAWLRNVDKGYSNTRASSYAQSDVIEYGAEMAADMSDKFKLYAKTSKSERDKNSFLQTQITVEYDINTKFSVSAEIKDIQTKETNTTVDGIIGALRINYEPVSNLETFLTGQATLENDGGAYKNNDAVIVGARYLYDTLSTGARYIAGHRGDAVTVDISHQLNKDHTIYGGYTWSDNYASDYDRTLGSALGRGFTVGQRWNIANKATLYNESQLIKENKDKGVVNSLGMDFYIGEGWSLGFLYQKGEFDSKSGNSTDRDSLSFSIGKTSSVMNWASKLEYRQDIGAEDRRQWVTTNRLSYKLNDSWRLAGRFNHSDTKDNLNAQDGAKFTEANIGFAYRPYESAKWAFFGKYTYLYDLASLGQDIVNQSAYDQRSQVLSFEGVYKHDDKWEFALKYATRVGEARHGRGEGEWFDSKTSFYAGQVRYDILYKWHGLFEYRILKVKGGGIKQGYMIGADKDITENFRIGIGYNFTDFTDDLTKIDCIYRGWFINVAGIY
jgi:hypothetical protein